MSHRSLSSTHFQNEIRVSTTMRLRPQSATSLDNSRPHAKTFRSLPCWLSDQLDRFSLVRETNARCLDISKLKDSTRSTRASYLARPKFECTEKRVLLRTELRDHSLVLSPSSASQHPTDRNTSIPISKSCNL